MNKAAFLDILHHVSAITDQEISELEQLALNFPYCQSAHLLLAKAAYDRGSMLSNQKLRRAAACATNRQLLKKLIYTSGTDLVVTPLTPEENLKLEAPVEPQVEPQIKPVAEQTEPTEPTPELLPSAEILAEPTETIVAELAPESVPENTLEANPDKLPAEVAEFLLPASTTILEEENSPVEETVAINDESPAEEADLEDEVKLIEEIAPSVWPEELVDILDEYDALFIVDQLNPALPLLIDPVTAFISSDIVAELAGEAEPETKNTAAETKINLPASDFAATASDINTETDRVIAEDILARQDPLDADLPEENSLLANTAATDLQDEQETLTRFDEYLFTPEKEAERTDLNTVAPDYQEEIIYKVFDANELGYWMDSSRLGETLLVKNELATSQPYYFSPELFLEYSQHHELTSYQAPPTSILTRQLDIIDQFLKLNPKLKSMANAKISFQPQEDLSSRSTKIKKNIVSENLANILVKQGKIKKAIKIYEHLILKIPEKKAYFASQIEKLQLLS